MRILKSHSLLSKGNNYIIDSPQPSNLSYAWNFGSLLAVCLIIQIVTGVTLAMHYNASVLEAFNSVEHIMRDVNNGWLIRYLHSNTASAFFFIVYLHIGRGLYYGSYKAPRTLTWTIGTVIFILMMATAFLGYVLPYGQMSLWGATVITNLLSAIPWIGQDIVEFVWGGFSVNNATLNRFFALHFVLPFVLAALALMHLIALHDSAGSGNPLGISGNYDRLPMAPYFLFKDLITIFLFIVILSVFVFFMPNVLGDSENYVMANPMQTPPAIVPEWYLLPFYAILRSIPNKLLGVIAMFSAILILLVMPYSDLSRNRGIQFRPLSKIAFFAFVANFLILMQLGAKHVESPFIEFGQISTVLYFSHYLFIVPFVSLLENTLIELYSSSFGLALMNKIDVSKLMLTTRMEIVYNQISFLLFRNTYNFYYSFLFLFSQVWNPVQIYLKLKVNFYKTYILSKFYVFKAYILAKLTIFKPYLLKKLNFIFFKLLPVILIIKSDYALYNVVSVNICVILLYMSSAFSIYILLVSEYRVGDVIKLFDRIKKILNKNFLTYALCYIIFAFMIRSLIIQGVTCDDIKNNIECLFCVIVNTIIPITILFRSILALALIKPDRVKLGNAKAYATYKERVQNIVFSSVNPANFIYTIALIYIMIVVRNTMIIWLVPLLFAVCAENLAIYDIPAILHKNLLSSYRLYMDPTEVDNEEARFMQQVGEELRAFDFFTQYPYLATLACRTTGQDVRLDGSNHANSSEYCLVGRNIIRMQALKKNIIPERLESQMAASNVTCFEVCESLPVDDRGLVMFKKNPLDISVPHTNREVHSLSQQLARVISVNLITNNRLIGTVHGNFEKMHKFPIDLRFRDIKADLTESQIELLVNCVKTNPSLYATFNLNGDVIPDNTYITNYKYGYKLPNLINAIGLDKTLHRDTLSSSKIKIFGLTSNIERSKAFVYKTISDFNTDYIRNYGGSGVDTHIPHGMERGFCENGQFRMEEKSNQIGIPAKGIEKILEEARVVCNDLFVKLPMENGLLVVKENELDLSIPHPNPEIANLARTIANCCTRAVQYNLPKIAFSGDSFNRMLKPDQFVTYRDIWAWLSKEEEALFLACVQTNPSYYPSIIVQNSAVVVTSQVLTVKGGYRIPNFINKYGTDKQVNYRTLYKQALKAKKGGPDSDNSSNKRAGSNKRPGSNLEKTSTKKARTS